MNNEPNIYNKAAKFAKISAITSGILAFVIALSYFFALRFDFDYGIGHFERGSIFFYILVTSIIAAAALPAALAVYSKKKASITTLPSVSGAHVFLTIFASAMAVFAFASSIPDLSMYLATSKLSFFSVIGLLVIAVALITSVVSGMSSSPLVQILLTLSVLAMDIQVLAAYFDQTLTLNSPVRHITMLAELSVMIFLLSEARLAFGLAKAGDTSVALRASFPFYVFANNASAALSIGFSIGAILHDIIPGGSHSFTAHHPHVLRLAMYAILGVLALLRAFQAAKISSPYVPLPENGDEAKADTANDTNPPEATEEN